MQHPRFVSGNFNTGFIAEEFPKGFHSSALVHDDPLLLAAVAALARRRYIARAVQTSGQLRGHRRRVGHDWVVTVAGREFSLRLTPVEGGCTIACDGEILRAALGLEARRTHLPRHLERRAGLPADAAHRLALPA